jgi:Lon protease-like protein
MTEDLAVLQDFNGVARLFPLPGLVFFPHAVQPLHIFEQRYRQMTADALAGDHLIAPVLLRPGWEENYDDNPAVHPVGCLGRIVMESQMPDGRYNLVLRGLARVRIREEPPTDRQYRVARVEILRDEPADDVDELMALRAALSDTILPHVNGGPVREQLLGLFKGELPLGHLCDVLGFALPLPPEGKQQLLEELSVTARARLLMECFRSIVEDCGKPTGAGSKRFPPDFSAN